MNKNKKGLLLSILGIIGLLVITIGVTYAFFNYAKEGTTENSITTGTITFLYTEVSGVGRGISIDDAYPISDSVGKVQKGEGKVFDFKVTSTTPENSSIPYEVTARKKTGSTLEESVVKLYLTKVSGESEEEILLDNYSNLTPTTKVDSTKYVEKTIYKGKVPSGSSKYEENFRLRMWIDEETDFSYDEEKGEYPYNDKEFTIIVNVYANAKVVTEEDVKAEITDLTVDGVEVNEVTGKDYNYEANLPEGTKETIINVETVSEYATVEIEKIDSLAAASNVKRLAVKKTLELNEGNNYFKITVTSENGEVENEYKLKIKVGKENINTLKSLSLSNCTLSPAFSSEVTEYTCTVGYDIDSVTVNADTTSDLATTKITGNTGLVFGSNTVNVEVTAENGEPKTYKVTVTKQQDTDATLKSLSLTGCTLSPTFSSGKDSYTCTVGYDVTSTTVSATANSSVAKSIEGTGSKTLNVGANTIQVKVTAQSGATKTYTVTVTRKKYTEELLNGADPVLTENLVPVKISSTGVVTKANLSSSWYDYETKNWANAVVLKSATTYATGATIPESNIESYFVWIPKYSYKLFDLGNYSSLTSVSSKEQTIQIKFGLTNTSDSKTGECTTPGAAGSSGNCVVGDYMTHPAFIAFDTNGIWVGKFETGYDGATSTSAAETNVDIVDTSKIIIKPNVYSWRNITVGNAFKNSYDYLRNDESHMMKNTEWGAVAYLQHSAYGSAASVRINNNKGYITGYAATEEPTKGYNLGTSISGNRNQSTSLGVDGTYTVNYLNTSSVVASTTGNYTGVYDMSGGCFEYVMGYATGASTTEDSSTITSLYSDFFTNSSWNKYYDKYSSTADTNYNNRILGDATGEMGTFGSQKDPDGETRYKSSWYNDYAYFTLSSSPWFRRSAHWQAGNSAGVYSFRSDSGRKHEFMGYRVVLAPQGGSN